MNEWINNSIVLANSPGYLDSLSEIYPMKINPVRPLTGSILAQIKNAYETNNSELMIKLLIDNAPVFPVKDSYIGFIRKKPMAIQENPTTLKRIADRIYSLGFDKMIAEASRPKETNRQLGSAFKNWSQNTLGFTALNQDKFLESEEGVYVLKGGDKKLKTFANSYLKCELTKGIDIIIKIDQKYVIGEAKFLTTPGGEQDRGFDDAHSFISNKKGNAKRIAILDGYIWLKTESGLHEKINQYGKDEVVLSSILLKDYILNLQKSLNSK